MLPFSIFKSSHFSPATASHIERVVFMVPPFTLDSTSQHSYWEVFTTLLLNSIKHLLILSVVLAPRMLLANQASRWPVVSTCLPALAVYLTLFFEILDEAICAAFLERCWFCFGAGLVLIQNEWMINAIYIHTTHIWEEFIFTHKIV